MAHELAQAARDRAPQSADYHEDKMLGRLLREALFHRDSERRHLAALLISASPFAPSVTDELLILLEDHCRPSWVRGRAATTIRYLSDDAHRLRMLKFVEDRDDGVAVPITHGLGHLSYNELSDQALRTSLGTEASTRERAKFYALGMTGSPAPKAIGKSAKSPDWQISAARWWSAHGPAVRS